MGGDGWYGESYGVYTAELWLGVCQERTDFGPSSVCADYDVEFLVGFLPVMGESQGASLRLGFIGYGEELVLPFDIFRRTRAQQ